MLTAGDKLIYSILTALVVSLLFSMYELYYSSYIQLNQQIYIVLQLFTISVPMYFFILNTEDGLFGFLIGVMYVVFKQFIIGAISSSMICFSDVFMFSLSLMFIGLALGFQREQTFKNAKLNMLGVFIILLAYLFSIFLLFVYSGSYAGIYACYTIPQLHIF